MHSMRVPEVSREFSISERDSRRLPKIELVAVSDEGSEYGSISYSFNPERRQWEIDQLQVAESHRGSGVGSSLVAAFVEQVGSDAYVKTNLHDEETKESVARNFSRQLDRAREIGNRPFTVGGNELILFPMVGFLASNGLGTVHVEIAPIEQDQLSGEANPQFPFTVQAVGMTSSRLT